MQKAASENMHMEMQKSRSKKNVRSNRNRATSREWENETTQHAIQNEQKDEKDSGN